MTTYRGSPVDSVEFNRKDDVFRLLNIDGEIMAELKRHEFLSQPQLRTMRLSNGRHRRTRAAFRGNPAGQSGFSGAAGAFLFSSAGNTWWSSGDAKPAKPIEDAGIRAGEVIAHRCWRVVGDRLHSAYKRQQAWLPGHPMTGDVRHEYGVHAFKDAAYLGNYIMGIRVLDSMAMIAWNSGEIVHPVPTPIAVGTIALWGEIVEHERGYRAEFGKVISLDQIVGKDVTMLDRLRSIYGLNHPVGQTRERS